MFSHFSIARIVSLIVCLVGFQSMLYAQWEKLEGPSEEPADKIYDMGNALVLQAESGCFRSEDNGLSWQKTFAFDYFSTFAVTCRDGQDLYVLCRNKGLYKSSDAGQTWDLLTNQGFAFLNSLEPTSISLTDNYIFFSTARGVHRFDRTAPYTLTTILDDNDPSFSGALVLKTNGNSVWMTLNDSLLRSTDYAASWDVVHEGYNTNGFEIFEDTILLCTVDGVYRSVDAGNEWTQVRNTTFNYTPFKAQNRWFYYSEPFLYVSSDGGNTWGNYFSIHITGGVTDVLERNNTRFACNIFGVLRSENNSDFVYVNKGLTPYYNFIVDPHIQFVDSLINYADYFSRDNGISWYKLSLESYSWWAIQPFKFKNIWFALEPYGYLYRADNDLLRWEKIGTSLGGWLRFYVNDQHLYKVQSIVNTGAEEIQETLDNGETWISVGSNQSIPGNMVLGAFKNYLFSWGETFGLERSVDGGNSWASIGSGLPWLSTPQMYTDNNRLFIYNEDNIFVSENDGLSFVQINANLTGPQGNAGAISLSVKGNYLFVCNKNGVYYSPVLADQWVNITDNVTISTQPRKPSLTVHNGYVFLDNGDQYPLWRRPVSSLNLVQTKQPDMQGDLGKLSVYPNPADDAVSVLTFQDGQVKVKILSQTGNIMLEKDEVSHGQSLKIDKLAVGVYFVAVEKHGRITSIQPLVVRH